MKASQRRILLAVSATFTIALLLFAIHRTSTFVISRKHNSVGEKNKGEDKAEPAKNAEQKNRNKVVPSNKEHEKLAYAIFLSGTLDQDEDLDEDKYFVAVRIAIWQLLHKKDTRASGIDVVVMVTPTVSESRRALMAKDGAIVYPVEMLHVANDSWIHQDEPRWADVMTKLRVLQMTQYDRILMLDGDTILRRPLDGVFDDPAAQVREVDISEDYKPLEGVAPLPKTYLMAGKPEVHCWHVQHGFPPQRNQINVPENFNAGFMMFAPSIDMFNYYVSYLSIKDSFDPKYPEQNLLNLVHKWGGPMPWQELEYKWNTLCPNVNDFEKGIHSAHEKWWGRDPGLGEVDEEVRMWLYAQRYEMKGWYDAQKLKQQDKAPKNLTQKSISSS